LLMSSTIGICAEVCVSHFLLSRQLLPCAVTVHESELTLQHIILGGESLIWGTP